MKTTNIDPENNRDFKLIGSFRNNKDKNYTDYINIYEKFELAGDPLDDETEWPDDTIIIDKNSKNNEFEEYEFFEFIRSEFYNKFEDSIKKIYQAFFEKHPVYQSDTTFEKCVTYEYMGKKDGLHLFMSDETSVRTKELPQNFDPNIESNLYYAPMDNKHPLPGTYIIYNIINGIAVIKKIDESSKDLTRYEIPESLIGDLNISEYYTVKE